jgi:hypothetical protein
MILLHGVDIPMLKSEIRSFFQEYKFTTFRDWWEMNRLRLANGKDSNKTVCNLNLLSGQMLHSLTCSFFMTIGY